MSLPSTTPQPDAASFVQDSLPFVRYLAAQSATRPTAGLAEIIAAAGGASHVAIVVVDVINGFCTEGPLASARVGVIVPPIVALLTEAHAAGVRHIALVGDRHSPDAAEFAQFPPHCIAGSAEAEPVDMLKALPFYAHCYRVSKNSISAGPSLAHLVGHSYAPTITTVIVVGDCTDLCVYHLALPLKLAANQENRALRVIVPADCVQTYDLPVDVAARIGALPHPGDVLHEMALYQLRLGGVEVVSTITLGDLR